MHPPKTDTPARQPDPGEREDHHVYHIWRLSALCCQAIVCGSQLIRERTRKD
jgi:hypothetical protein